MERNSNSASPRMEPARLYVRSPGDEALRTEVTDRAAHFCVCHMGVAHVDPAHWVLAVGGYVEHARRYTLTDIMQRPRVERRITLECAGNPLNLDQPIRRVSNAAWTGCMLRDLLDECKLLPDARYVWFQGADYGSYGDVYSPDYVKYVSIDRVYDTQCMIAYEMNGAALPAEHGFPARVLIPGCYGTNSVKWVQRIGVSVYPPAHRYTTDLYTMRRGNAGATPIWDMEVNSRIVSPAEDEVVAVEPVPVWGWAWSAHEITRVEVSVDAGQSWFDAELQPKVEDQWQKFSAEWTPRSHGQWAILSRAHDAAGRCQPPELHINQITRKVVTVEDR